MKKSNQSLNKTISRKDLINSFSSLSALLIVVYGIVLFLLALSPEKDYVNGGYFFNLANNLFDLNEATYKFSFETEYCILLTLFASIALGISQFEFLHRKKYCSTLLSFGINRKRIFLNRVIPPLTAMAICLTIPNIIALKLNIETHGFTTELLSFFFLEYLRLFQIMVVGFVCGVATCIFTGRTLEAVAGAISVVILPLSLTCIANEVFESFLYGYSSYDTLNGNLFFTLFDPTYITTLILGEDIYSTHTPNTLFTKQDSSDLIASLLWLVLSAFIVGVLTHNFSKRFKPENSGFKGINKQMVFLTSFSIPLLLSSVIIEYIEDYFYPAISSSLSKISIVIAIALGFGCCIICNLIIHFTYKKLKVSIISGAILCLTILSFTIAGATQVFGTFNKSPSAEEIVKIELNSPFAEFFPDVHDYECFAQQIRYTSTASLVATDKKDIEVILDLHNLVSDKKDNATSSSFKITYTLADGTTITRNYKYLGEESIQKVIKLWDTRAAKELYKNCLFPELDIDDDGAMTLGEVYTNSFVADYKEERAILNITSRDGATKSVLKDISEKDYNTLKKAIYKDICTLNSSEWFTPEETQIGKISFGYSSYFGYSQNPETLDFYIISNMENTINTLKDLNLYQYFECKKEIKSVLVSDIKEYISWENRGVSLSKNKMDSAVHQPYFTQNKRTINFTAFCFSYLNSDTVFDNPPVNAISNKLEIKTLLEKGYLAYNIGNNGKIVFVKYTDGTFSSYVIPYEK